MRQLAKITVLIAHSDPLISAGLAATLTEQGDFNVVMDSFESRAVLSLDEASTTRGIAVADYDSGLHLIGSAPSRNRVVILTDKDSEVSICRALEQGARGYLLLGCPLAELMNGIRTVCDGGVAVGPLVASRIAERMEQRELSKRESEILEQVMFGLSNKRIALELRLSEGTVKTHVKSILRKLGAVSRTHAVAIARHRGLLPEGSIDSDPSKKMPGRRGQAEFAGGRARNSGTVSYMVQGR
jgi:DNA-binding NarL/FixJ family response regulator